MSSFRQIKDSSLQPSKALSRNQEHGGYIVNGRTTTFPDGGPAWLDGLNAATPIKHSPGKNDGADIGRGKVVTW
jgi:hypothetical protein